MFKRTLLTVFVVVLAVSFTNAQNKSVVKGVSTATKQLVVDAAVESTAPVSQSPAVTFPSNPGLAGDQLTTSTYDYFTNSIVREMVVFYKGVPHITLMERGANPAAPSATTRLVTYFTKDAGNNWVKTYPWGLVAKGWGTISVGTKSGSQTDGVLAMVSHAPNQLAVFDGTSWVASTFEATTDPSLMVVGDDIFVGASNNRTNFKLWKTSDLGGTYTFIDSIQGFAAKGGFAAPGPIANGGVELGMAKSADEKYLLNFGTLVGDAVSASSTAQIYNGFTRATADNLFLIWTDNNGATWTQKAIGWDGDTTLTSITRTEKVDTLEYVSSAGDTLKKVFGTNFTFKYAPLFENFGQIDAAVANDGTVHVIANGYGLFVTSVKIAHPTKPGVVDTVSISTANGYYPIIYWNSKTNTWKEISAPAYSSLADSTMGDKRPGNGQGQAYPSIGITADGGVVYATWMAPEHTGSVSDASVTIDATTGLRFTDLHHVFSTDGGATFTAPAVYGSVANSAESFPTVSQLLEVRAGKVIAPVVFMNDIQAGTSLFASNGASSTNPVLYIETDLGAVGVEPIAGPADFNLEQNYPNPFNPSTQINFSLPVSGNVTLKVFSALGEEVATLINEVKSAGSYSVDFNASNLTSGVYFYSLQHNGAVSTKKMVLMK